MADTHIADQRIAEICDRAANLVKGAPRLLQHSYTDGDGCYCLVGAIRHAICPDRPVGASHWEMLDHHLFYAVIDAVKVAIGQAELEDRSGGVFGWSDAPGRTKAEVVRVLRKAAAAARRRAARVDAGGAR